MTLGGSFKMIGLSNAVGVSGGVFWLQSESQQRLWHLLRCKESKIPPSVVMRLIVIETMATGSGIIIYYKKEIN